jgi:hypothetical protein
MGDMIAAVLGTAWVDFMTSVQTLLPHLIAMLILILVGWVIAWVIGFVLRHVLRWLKFDMLANRVGATALLKRMALPAPSEVVSSLIFWLVWVMFLLSGLEALGFSGVESLTGGFVGFLPRLGVGLVILVVGLIAANFVWRATLLAAVNANLPSARLLSGGVRLLVAVLTVAMALEQIGVAKAITLTAFAIAFGAIMLGVGIAVGIGGAPLARRLIERQFPEDQKKEGAKPDELSHL